jgi:hypothetical protein
VYSIFGQQGLACGDIDQDGTFTAYSGTGTLLGEPKTGAAKLKSIARL